MFPLWNMHFDPTSDPRSSPHHLRVPTNLFETTIWTVHGALCAANRRNFSKVVTGISWICTFKSIGWFLCVTVTSLTKTSRDVRERHKTTYTNCWKVKQIEILGRNWGRIMDSIFNILKSLQKSLNFKRRIGKEFIHGFSLF